MSIPNSTVTASKFIAEELGVDYDLVHDIVKLYIKTIYKCLMAEVPFNMNGLLKFFHAYEKVNATKAFGQHKGHEYFEDKVAKILKTELYPNAKPKIHGWVHDFGIKSNKQKELVKIHLRPIEIEKMRKRKVLEEQRKLGFRSELLFDDMPANDKAVSKSYQDDELTVEQIMSRLGYRYDS